MTREEFREQCERTIERLRINNPRARARVLELRQHDARFAALYEEAVNVDERVLAYLEARLAGG